MRRIKRPARRSNQLNGLAMARVVCALSLTLLGSGARGDRAPRPGPASAAATGSYVLPRFAILGWVIPPNESTTAARIQEMAGAGLNGALPAWADSGRLADNLKRLHYAADNGIRCLAWDERFDAVYNQGAATALLDTIVADYSVEPGFLGYYFTDEPAVSEFPQLARIYADLRARDPVHPAFDNLLGIGGFGTRADWEQYARSFIETVHPAVLCDDHYDFLIGQDHGRFVENVVAMRALSAEYGLPYWCVVLLVQHGPYRALTDGELRWQVSHLLAYGARGVGYFTYWTPAYDPVWHFQPAVIGYDGVRTHWYDMLAAFNPRVLAAGELLAGLDGVSTQHAGSVPIGGIAFAPDDWIGAVTGRAAIGRFAAGSGASQTRYLLIANSDSLAPRTIGLTLPGTLRVWRLGAAANSWSDAGAAPEFGGVELDLTLEAGDFALLRLEPDPAAEHGPVIVLGPNPASGSIRLSVSHIGGAATLEIHDAMGRRVWSARVVPGAAPLAWSGEREGGGHAGPGIYFARVTDGGRVTTTRFAWLGTP